ncbi:MAG: hypothetical protein RL885_17790 [Planctomycetota bacterium]
MIYDPTSLPVLKRYRFSHVVAAGPGWRAACVETESMDIVEVPVTLWATPEPPIDERLVSILEKGVGVVGIDMTHPEDVIELARNFLRYLSPNETLDDVLEARLRKEWAHFREKKKRS